MRFKLKKLEPRKKEFEIFIKDGFLFLPKKFNNEIRWLEKVKKVYRHSYFNAFNSHIGYVVNSFNKDGGRGQPVSVYKVHEKNSDKAIAIIVNDFLNSVMFNNYVFGSKKLVKLYPYRIK